MASPCKDGRIQFIGLDGERHTFRVGKSNKAQRRVFCEKAETILADLRLNRSHDEETVKWLRALDVTVHRRMIRVGLVKADGRANVTLGDFLRRYFESISVKPGTRTAYEHVRRNLEGMFTPAKLLRDIGPEDGDNFRTWLTSVQKLSPATVARRITTARQMFKRAVRWKLVNENPFADVKGGSQKNKARQRFIARETIQAVLDACPNAEWRLIVALSRFGGLRCPSEHLALEWGGVDFEKGTIFIDSPKTGPRSLPLFPELEPLLLECHSQAEPGTRFVIGRGRSAAMNLRTQLERIIRKAKVASWPRIFHNLRASRQTELEEFHPSHVVCAWLGNSENVARDHYLMVRDEDFERATGKGAKKVAQNAAQHGVEITRIGSQGGSGSV